MGAKGAVEIIYRKEAGDPEKIAARTKAYEARFMSPFVAAERGYIDEVIMPHSTRRRVARALRLLRGKELSQPVEEARQHSAVRRHDTPCVVFHYAPQERGLLVTNSCIYACDALASDACVQLSTLMTTFFRRQRKSLPLARRRPGRSFLTWRAEH